MGPAGNEFKQRQTLLEDRRCGADGGSFFVRNPDVGEAWTDAATADREQIPALYSGGCEAVEAGAFSTESARAECRGDCGTVEARRADRSRGGWQRGGDWITLEEVAGEAAIAAGASGARSWNLSWFFERAGALADERVGGDAAQAGAVL